MDRSARRVRAFIAFLSRRSPGNYADITLFDPERVADKATYEKPFQYSEGIEYVIVNGQIVLERGKHTGTMPGKVLRRNP